MTSRTAPTTSIARSTPDKIFVRNIDLVDKLIGKISFTEMMLLHYSGQRPTAGQTRILDAALVTLMEHGLTPSAIATRLIYYSAPDALQAAVAAGLLGVGSTFIGTMEGCAGYLEEILAVPEAEQRARARAIVERHRQERRPIHGFGHPFHKPDDPRTPLLLSLAEEEGMPCRHVAALRLLSAEVDAAYGRHVTINATGAVAALLAEIGIPVGIMRGVATVSRAAGLVGHILEEQHRPSGAHIWKVVEEGIPYEA